MIFCVLKVSGCHTNRDRQWHPIDIDKWTTEMEDAYDHELRVTQSMHKDLTEWGDWCESLYFMNPMYFLQIWHIWWGIQNVSQFCTTTECVYEPVLFVSTSGSILLQKREDPKLNKNGNSTIFKPHTPLQIVYYFVLTKMYYSAMLCTLATVQTY